MITHKKEIFLHHLLLIFLDSSVPSKYPVNIQGKGSTPFTLNISWQPLAKIDHNGPGLYYIVYHQRADSQGKPQRNEVHNGSSFLVSAADYYMKYTIKVQAANNIGFGPKSPAIFAYSGEMGKITIGTIGTLGTSLFTQVNNKILSR